MPTTERGGNPRIADHDRSGITQGRVRCPHCGEQFGNLPTHLKSGCDKQ